MLIRPSLRRITTDEISITPSSVSSSVSCNQGHKGDALYVVKSGSFVVLKTTSETNSLDVETNFKSTLVRGACFGEISLMYDIDRTNSVIAKEDSVVWKISRTMLKHIMVNITQERLRGIFNFISVTPLFFWLHASDRTDLTLLVRTITLAAGKKYMVKPNEFLIVQSGLVHAREMDIDKDSSDVNVLSRGGWVGCGSKIDCKSVVTVHETASSSVNSGTDTKQLASNFGTKFRRERSSLSSVAGGTDKSRALKMTMRSNRKTVFSAKQAGSKYMLLTNSTAMLEAKQATTLLTINFSKLTSIMHHLYEIALDHPDALMNLHITKLFRKIAVFAKLEDSIIQRLCTKMRTVAFVRCISCRKLCRGPV